MIRRELKEILLEVGYNLYEAVKWGWRPYIILITLLPLNLNGQSTEESQKRVKVMEKREMERSTITVPPTTPIERGNTILRPRVYQPYYYHPQQWGYNPYWNPYRSWDGRTYILTNDTSKLSPTPPLRISFGILSEVTTPNPNTISPYLIIGREGFLILQYHVSLPNTIPHYHNIYSWEVEQWGDEPMGTPMEVEEFFFGFGRNHKRVSVFLGMGFYKFTTWDAFFDETYTLASYRQGGIYTINEQEIRNINSKIGLIYGFQRWELMTQISMGMDVRFGMGIGLKL